MSRVLITGANGFAGPYVAAALAERGHQIVGVSHAAVNIAGGPVERWLVADLADPVQAREAVEMARPDMVVHLAAISFVAHADVTAIYSSNIIGTRNLLDAIASSGGVSGPTIIASSANVYGSNVGGALHEGLSLHPQSDYALSKVACEYLAEMYAGKVRSIVVRPFNYTGVGQAQNFLIPKIVDHVKRRAATIELGNIEVARDFSDVRFFAEAVARLLAVEVRSAEKVNICSGVAYSLKAVLEAAALISNHRMNVTINPAFVRSNEVEKLWGDPAKLQSLIGPLVSPPLEETLRWMIED
ncbi:MAG: GDP-mannose 4,6-dehydratase [Sphingomonas sp.]|nr:GDP-mannose 4,6-dehydratase [Sphingomonas sp.]